MYWYPRQMMHATNCVLLFCNITDLFIWRISLLRIILTGMQQFCIVFGWQLIAVTWCLCAKQLTRDILWHILWLCLKYMQLQKCTKYNYKMSYFKVILLNQLATQLTTAAATAASLSLSVVFEDVLNSWSSYNKATKDYFCVIIR